MNKELHNSLIGGFAIFTRAPWYIRLFWPKTTKFSKLLIIVEDFNIDKEWLDFIRKSGVSIRIYRPRKSYSTSEVNRWVLAMLDHFGRQADISPREFAELANITRPNTFTKANNIKDLVNNKYYIRVI